jgi:hypothetical protein
MPWSDEARAAAAERLRLRWQDGKMIAALNRPEVREKMIAAAKAAAARPEVREKRIAALNRPEVREKRIAALNRPEVREKRIAAAKAAAARPEVREKMIAAAKARRDPWLASLSDIERDLYTSVRAIVGAKQARADIERMRARSVAPAA